MPVRSAFGERTQACRRYARSLATDPQHTGIGAGAVVTAGRAGTIAVACAADVPFEEWMRSPELQLEGIVCGCADRIRHIAPVSLPADAAGDAGGAD